MRYLLSLSFRILLLFTLLAQFQCMPTSSDAPRAKAQATGVGKDARPAYAMVIHGGAGTILRSSITDEQEAAIKSVLNEALSKGKTLLEAGTSAVEVVEQVIMVLEDAPYFNAGKGAVFTNSGINELDASIMEGQNRMAGAVGGVSNIKNPIRAARAVMEKSPHVLLVGEGAEAFAMAEGIDTVDAKYFYTEDRWEALERVKAREADQGFVDPAKEMEKYGTVGAVVLDKEGNLAAGTSTGGMTNKRFNRLGDSPIIGAGTYANNATCAISCTGHGEFFIRYAVAYDVSALMEYGGLGLEAAADSIIHQKLKSVGGSGGLIGVDKMGNICMPFNTPGMYRGYVLPDQQEVKIFED